MDTLLPIFTGEKPAMQDIMNIRSADVNTAEKRADLTVSIIGCNREGLFFSIAFAEAGYKTIITDVDQSVLRKFSKGKLQFVNEEVNRKLRNLIRIDKISSTNEQKNALMKSQIVVVSDKAKIDAKKKIDFSQIENDCKQIGISIKKGTLIIFGSILKIGFIEGFVKDKIENSSGLKLGTDFGLAYSPQLLDKCSNRSLEFKVSALEPCSLKAASTIPPILRG